MAVLPTVESLGARSVPGGAPRSVVPIRGGVAEDAAAAAANQMSKVYALEAEKLAKEDAEREARDLDTMYSDAIRKLEYGDGTPENPGYLNLKGQAAIDARDSYLKAQEETYKRIYGMATSDRVTKIIRPAFDRRRSGALDSGVRHFGTQRHEANKKSVFAHIKSIEDDAAIAARNGDSARVAFLAKQAGIHAADWAKKNGDDPEYEAQKVMTGILYSEIKRLNLKDSTVARAFFEENKRLIDGRLYTEIEETLKGGEVKTWAEERSGSIAAAGGTLAQQLAKARASKRVNGAPATVAQIDELVSRVKIKWQEKEANEADMVDKLAYSKFDAFKSTGQGHTALMAMAANEKNHKVRAKLETLLVQQESRRLRDENAAKAAMKEKAYAWAAENDPGVPMPDDIYKAAVKGNYLDDLEKTQAERDIEAPALSDEDKWLEFNRRSDLHEMSNAEYKAKYEPFFSLADRARAVSMFKVAGSSQEKLLRAEANKLNKPRSYGSAGPIVTSVVNGLKLNTSKSKVLKGQLGTAMRGYIDQYVEDTKGKYPTATELNKFAAQWVLQGYLDVPYWSDEAKRRGPAMEGGAGSVEEGQAGSFYLRTDDKDLPFIAQASGIPQKYLPGLIKQLKGAYEPRGVVDGKYRARQETPVTLDNLEDTFINNRDYGAIGEAVGMSPGAARLARQLLRDKGYPVTLSNLARAAEIFVDNRDYKTLGNVLGMEASVVKSVVESLEDAKLPIDLETLIRAKNFTKAAQ